MLEISSVHAGYDRTTVLHGVTVPVQKDGVVTVLGHNGAGGRARSAAHRHGPDQTQERHRPARR